MPTATIPNAGTYDLEVDIGFSPDAFRLDSANAGTLDGPNVLDGTTSYASITNYVLSLSIARGRKDPDDQFPAGTMGFVLNDTGAAGVFGPFDTASPYYDDLTDYPGLAPGRLVRLTRYDSSNNPELMFVGRIVNYEYQFQLGGIDTVSVYCADDLLRLANTFMTGHNPTKELTGARIAAVLDRTEVAYPSGAARNIAAGTVELGGSTSYAIPAGQNVKAYFDEITYTAERGRIFIDREGVLVSQNRVGTALTGSVVDFTDDPANLTGAGYRALGITFKVEDVLNRVAVTPAGGSQQVAEDLDSQATYFVKSLYIEGSLLHDNSAALTLAEYLLQPDAEPRFNQVETWYGSLSAANRDACSTVDIGSTITIEKQVPVGGTPTAKVEELAVEGIEHLLTFANGHVARFYTSPTTIVYPLLLDDPIQGLLDQNVLT